MKKTKEVIRVTGARTANPDIEPPEGADAVAHAALRLVGDHPGTMGRLRVARIVAGFPVDFDADITTPDYSMYAVDVGWTLRYAVELIDALIDGGFIVQTVGMRPTLVLTRPGHRALEALDAGG